MPAALGLATGGYHVGVPPLWRDEAATKAIESTSSHDAVYKTTDNVLAGLLLARDKLAGLIKGELEAAAFHNTPVESAQEQTAACGELIKAAAELAQHA